jgi:hypothetical protein
VWAPTHAGRVDGRPPRRLRAAKEIRGAHHLQLLGSSGGRFTVDELGQRASFIGAQRGPACGAGSERGNGTVSAGALDAGARGGGDRVLTSQWDLAASAGTPHAVGDRVLGARGAAALSAATRLLLGCYSAAACGAPPGHRGTCRAARRPIRDSLTTFDSQISSATFLPSGPEETQLSATAFRANLRLKIAKFGYYSGPTPLREQRRSDRLEPVPAPLTLHYPH